MVQKNRFSFYELHWIQTFCRRNELFAFFFLTIVHRRATYFFLFSRPYGTDDDDEHRVFSVNLLLPINNFSVDDGIFSII